MAAAERILAEAGVSRRRRRASSSTGRPSRRTRSSRARSRAAASSRPRASATCSRSRARCGRRCTTRASRSRRRSCPRDRAFGVRERLGPDGEVLRPLDEPSVREVGGAPARARGRVGRGLPAARLRQPEARATRRRDPRRGAARGPDLALVRGRARVPRVPPRVDDRHQCRDPAGRRALPRAHRAAPRRGRASRPSCSSCSRAAACSARDAAAARPGLHGRVRARRPASSPRRTSADARPRATSSRSTWAARPRRSA